MRNNAMQEVDSYDSGTSDNEMPPTRKLGLGDTKKVLIMAGLLVVGGGIVAYQFLGNSGPATATAVTQPTTPGSAQPTVPAPNQPGVPGLGTNASVNEELSVAGIERLVNEFDGYVKMRQVPLGQLKTSPFRTPRARPMPQVGSDVSPSGFPVAEPVQVRAKPAMPALALGSIMVAGDQRWAVINNRLCSVGAVVAGCKVEIIEVDHVRISRDGETADLFLKPKTTDQE
jgi:hypothetical protein